MLFVYILKIQKIFFLEDEIKIKDLTLKITSMRENLQSKKQTLEYKNNLLSKHLDHVVIFMYFLIYRIFSFTDFNKKLKFNIFEDGDKRRKR